jgi:hypothetical protein
MGTFGPTWPTTYRVQWQQLRYRCRELSGFDGWHTGRWLLHPCAVHVPELERGNWHRRKCPGVSRGRVALGLSRGWVQLPWHGDLRLAPRHLLGSEGLAVQDFGPLSGARSGLQRHELSGVDHSDLRPIDSAPGQRDAGHLLGRDHYRGDRRHRVRRQWLSLGQRCAAISIRGSARHDGRELFATGGA